MAVLDRLRSWVGGWSVFASTGSQRTSDPLRNHYDFLERCYLNADVYDNLAFLALNGSERTDLKALRSLRNPANRVTEFYAAKLRVDKWLESIAYEDDADPSTDSRTAALSDVDVWSNWASEGRVAVRQYAWAGDLFLKASHKEDEAGEPLSVYRERIDPRHVSDFDKDERGYFTFLRLDIPKTRRLPDGDTESYTQTDIWDKAERTYRRYERTTDQLVDPVLDMDLDVSGHGAPDGFTGYDFIPVVHVKFRDVGVERGLSVFGHALSAIREADTIATRLHEMLFPETVWVLERQGTGPDGEPLPPIALENDASAPPGPSATISDGKGWARGYPTNPAGLEDNTVRIGSQRMVRLPSGGKLTFLIPDRNLTALSEVLAEQVRELERQLPETAYSRLRELELSGRALQYVLMDVIDRYEEAFANLSGGMARVNAMCLTLGQVLELEGFDAATIGTFEAGSFEHTFEMESPLPVTPLDEATSDLTQAQALAAFKALGPEPYRRALVEFGWSEEDAKAESATVQSAIGSSGAVAPGAIQRTTEIFNQLTGGGSSDGGQQ